jgi:hypothetical protein
MSRFLLASAALLVALLAGAPLAGAAFAPTNEEIVTAPEVELSLSGLGTDAQGNTLIAWEEQPKDPSAMARRLAANGTLGPVLDLDPGLPGRSPAVAMAPSGRAFVAWRAPADGNSFATGVRGRWLETDGSLGPVLTLAVGNEGVLNAGNPLLTAVDTSGVATIAWKNEIGEKGGELMLRRVQPNGTLSALVPDVTGNKPGDPKIAALPDGSTLFIYRNAFIERAVVGPNLELGAPAPISAENLGGEPLLAVDSHGNGLATWRRDTESSFGFRGRQLDPSGNPAGGEVIFEANLPGIPDNAALAADGADDFLAIWIRPDAEGDNVVHARPFNRLAGLTGPAQTVSNEDLNSTGATGAIDDFGTGAIAWTEFMGMGSQLPRGTAISSLGSPISSAQELFSRASVITSSSAPAAGVTAFLLRAASGPNLTFLIRRYLVPPRCGDSGVTRRKTGAIEIPLSCAGAGIEGAEAAAAPAKGELGTFNPAGPTLLYTPKPGAGGNDSFVFRAVNDGGASNLATVTIRDRLKPVVRKLRLVRPKAGKSAGASSVKGARRGRRRPYFSLRLSEPSRARVSVERRAKGKRFVRIGKVGSRKARLKLKLPVPAKLAAKIARGGRLRATAVATDTAGNRSRPKRVSIGAAR